MTTQKPDPLELIRASIDKTKTGEYRPSRPVPICLRGDLNAEILKLDEELSEIGQNATAKLGENPDAQRVAKKLKAVRAEAEKHTVTVVVRALSRGDWQKLVDKHPPKKADDADFSMTIYNDAVAPCIVEPAMDDATKTAFLDSLTQGQWDALALAAHIVNVGNDSVPKSVLASLALETSAAG